MEKLLVMSRRNYHTERNKSESYYTPANSYRLVPAEIATLAKKSPRFNPWELSFYSSIRKNDYRIVSGKQWQIVKKLIAK
jgi:hypothetical protein